MAIMAVHKFWMKFAGAVLVLFGLLGFLGTIPETNEPLRWSLDFLAWPLYGSHLMNCAKFGFCPH